MANALALTSIEPSELDTIQRTATLLAASGFFGTPADPQKGAMAQVAVKIMAGREMGFGPFASTNGIHIIQGKPAVGANLMAAAVRAHPRYDYKVKQLSDTVCELEFFDNGKPAGPNSKFTIQEATAAELTSGKNAHTWKKYPRNMLFARAMSNGVRWYCPDIFNGSTVYTPEELGAEVNDEGDVIDVVAKPVTNPESKVVDVPSQPQQQPQAQQQAVDNPFDDKPQQAQGNGAPQQYVTPERVKKLEELGETYYRDEWPKQRVKLVEAVSSGAASALENLLPDEAEKLIKGIEGKIVASMSTSQQAANVQSTGEKVAA